ncbi:thiosulfate oxidation carrier protein SoxY [Pseudorhodoferax sp. Leaf274]|uniref:thiosulfate oxidation carrier protein SoxY n=1 Tax=Pseudorhodoferax sp. Leaf274 TaxID=1736318 RepID=UPI0007030F56|nr:thiosulfate oxidation carrier protein SoxY [Pseudorhodoferax sp. Leaf274]KQP38004.1 thiosulfate oxidation carrier protein SoxY [Pseudorhodoferax sp. Leaf274]
MPTRRDTLHHGLAVAGLLAAAGWLPREALAFNKAAFDARSIADAAKAFGGGAPAESRDVVLTVPEIAENGAVVQMTLGTTLPDARQLLLLVERNPNVLVAMFELDESLESNFSINAKMSQSSDVYAVAIARDGKAFFARKEVRVTLGGCGA